MEKIAIPMSEEFIAKHSDSSWKFVGLSYADIHEIIKDEDASILHDGDYECLVKITKKGSRRAIYRKAIGWKESNFDTEFAMLTYRSMTKLGVKSNQYEKIIITRTNWFMYLWHHMESCIKYPFRIAIIFGVLSLLLSMIGILFAK